MRYDISFSVGLAAGLFLAVFGDRIVEWLLDLFNNEQDARYCRGQ